MENHWIVIITIIAYFALLLLISYFASRKSDNATFFSGNRKNPWILVSIATIGAAISGVTFISVPGMVVYEGYSYLQMCLGFIVGYFLIAFVLVPMFYKRNLVSIYGYLDERFGVSTYRSGAWFFFVSKMLGASARFFVVCLTLQVLVFDPLNIPFILNVISTIALIWLYTAQGGVKSVIWTDVLKSCCLVLSVVLCIYFIAQGMGFSFGEMVSAVAGDNTSQIFFFEDPKEGTYFWKKFLGGVFMVIATTGLDQDMMQRNLACKDSKESQKNMIVSSIVQFFVIALFLVLGTLLVMYMNKMAISFPLKPGSDKVDGDAIFGIVAQSNGMPIIVLILFVLGLISAAYSAAGSALTSLTTSFTIDILGGQKKYNDAKLTSVRKIVHIMMSIVMGIVLIILYYINNTSAINLVYMLASYTYGPILGLFVFGMFIKLQVHDKWVPVVCVLAPALSWVVQWQLKEQFNYTTSFELLIINAVLTIIGLAMLSKGKIEE